MCDFLKFRLRKALKGRHKRQQLLEPCKKEEYSARQQHTKPHRICDTLQKYFNSRSATEFRKNGCLEVLQKNRKARFPLRKCSGLFPSQKSQKYSQQSFLTGMIKKKDKNQFQIFHVHSQNCQFRFSYSFDYSKHFFYVL